MANVLVEEQSLQDIADAIREVTSTEDKLKPSEMGNAQRNFAKGLIDQANATTGKEDTTLTGAVGSLVEKCNSGGGGDSYYDTFWDSYQRNGERTDYSFAFHGTYWNDNNYKPKYPIKVVGIANYMYRNFGGTKIGNVDFSECTSQLTFESSKIVEFEELDFRKLQGLGGLFINCTALTTIKKIIVKSTQGFTNTFYTCTSLENIMFEGEIGKSISFVYSSKLSDTSIQNIIDCLVDLTGQTAQTVTFHANVKAKLTEEQIATITGKNWTLA